MGKRIKKGLGLARRRSFPFSQSLLEGFSRSRLKWKSLILLNRARSVEMDIFFFLLLLLFQPAAHTQREEERKRGGEISPHISEDLFPRLGVLGKEQCVW